MALLGSMVVKGKLPSTIADADQHADHLIDGQVESRGAPTFAVLVSVRLFSVVLFPLDGLPTRPMRGSRGMVLGARGGGGGGGGDGGCENDSML